MVEERQHPRPANDFVYSKFLDPAAERRARLPATLPPMSRDAILNLLADSIESSMEAQRLSAEYQKNKQLPKGSSDATTPSKRKKKTAEEVFYATMNGEALSVAGDQSLATSPYGAAASDDSDDYLNDDADDDDVADANSFACFEMFKEERMGDLLQQGNAAATGASPKKERSGTRRKKGHGLRGNSDHTKKSEVEGNSGCDTTTESSSTIPSSVQDELSVDDIQQYVMDLMPEEVKNMLPKEAWDKIFREQQQQEPDEESVATTKSTKVALKRLLSNPGAKSSRSTRLEVLDVQKREEDDDDEISVISELTSQTVAEAKEEEQRRRLQAKLAESSGRKKDDGVPDKKHYGHPSPILDVPSSHDEVVKKSTRFDDEPVVIGRRWEDSGAQHRVKFDKVFVRHYERVLELNPSVTNGPPIGIGWRYRRGGSFSVDQWEMEKNEISATKGSGAKCLVLPRSERENILYDLGYSQKDIAQAIRTVRKLKDQRRTTVDNLNVQSMEEAVENATYLMKNLIRVGRKRGLVRS